MLSKEEMLDAMEEGNWNHELTNRSSYEAVREEYQTMINEYEAAEDAMFPNGRDYDSEDW